MKELSIKQLNNYCNLYNRSIRYITLRKYNTKLSKFVYRIILVGFTKQDYNVCANAL